jgi:hypothetical protein
MKRLFLLMLSLLAILPVHAQHLLTPFEISAGARSATYAECMQFYHQLQSTTGRILIDSSGQTDAGPPLHTIRYPASTTPDAKAITIFINNGIHPGEPDGIDACMMLLRDIAEDKVSIPAHVRLVVIPVYNVGGALNRNNSTRVNQVGPESYGFRGNAQNLDLNRDFTKCDARESRLFTQIFQRYQPDIFIDNHVSDGADYQHTMTLLSTQYDKLGGHLGWYFRKRLDPMLYRRMEKAGWPMSPYVHAEESPEKGWTAFYDPPRLSSGYAALFNCIAWVPETHMLKPFDQRVASTYALMKEIIALAAIERDTILALRAKDRAAILEQRMFPLAWKEDTTATIWPFKGYTAAYKPSEVTGQQRLYYDHSRPTNGTVTIRDHYKAAQFVKAPQAYVIPQGWHKIIDRLLDNRRLEYDILERDTELLVTAYHIDSFKTSPGPYEGHYKHTGVHATPTKVRAKFLKGDYVFSTIGNPYRRFLIEMLEPEGDDSYFAWNFFDAILQRKEGYSDYRWEDVAAAELRDHPEVKAGLEARKREDPAFARDAEAQLFYVYRHSRWYEAAHMRYPVYRIE